MLEVTVVLNVQEHTSWLDFKCCLLAMHSVQSSVPAMGQLQPCFRPALSP